MSTQPVKKKFNFFSWGKDVGRSVVSHAGPVFSYVLTPYLGPLAGVVSSVVSKGLDLGVQWGMGKVEKWSYNRESLKSEKEVRKSIAKYIASQDDKVKQHRKDELAKWVDNNLMGKTRAEAVEEIKSGKVDMPKLHPELPTDKESKKQLKQIQGKLEKWVSI